MCDGKGEDMVFTLEEIKEDLNKLTEKQFYTKHIIRSDNWYFEEYLNKDMSDVMQLIDDYRLIVSEGFGISYNSVMMVGSGKIGYSMSPPSDNNPSQSKLFMPFNDDAQVRKVSDLDIAIISSDIFHQYWKLFRKSYKLKYQNTYLHLYNELYRGYINERNIAEVDGCRRVWNETALVSKKKLRNDLYFRHDISYRIYRSWEDFEEYNIQNISKIKKEIGL
ncbi:MAG: hypothetical protein IJM91_02230 [Lachnospiraceae bacterium]|nr:hypothetical protein [Lachnospiraceae bacterium]